MMDCHCDRRCIILAINALLALSLFSMYIFYSTTNVYNRATEIIIKTQDLHLHAIDKLRVGGHYINKLLTADTPYSNLTGPSKPEIMKSVGFHTWCKKVHRNNLTFTPYTDKHAVKEFVQSVAPDLKYAREYANVINATAITDEFLNKLPENYFMKAAHMCGGVVKINGDGVKCLSNCVNQMANESKTSYLRRLCDRYLKVNYAKAFGERIYQDIPHRCIFEEQFPVDKNDFMDYKVWTFYGKPMFIHIDSNRFSGHRKNIRTPGWREIPMKMTGGGGGGGPVQLPPKKPDFFNEMLRHSYILSKSFKHARVDFFVFNNSYTFSEITAAHMFCNGAFAPEIFERFYGFVIAHPGMDINPEYALKLPHMK